ncbi:MAG TPA: hypothetical protein VFH34_01430 [Anaerolineales bacterium]|nr:hypothetical protein [Anaerolineales bacterium]
MRGHVGDVHLTVAGVTRFDGKGGDIVMVTVIAGERFARSRQLVTV